MPVGSRGVVLYGLGKGSDDVDQSLISGHGVGVRSSIHIYRPVLAHAGRPAQGDALEPAAHVLDGCACFGRQDVIGIKFQLQHRRCLDERPLLHDDVVARPEDDRALLGHELDAALDGDVVLVPRGIVGVVVGRHHDVFIEAVGPEVLLQGDRAACPHVDGALGRDPLILGEAAHGQGAGVLDPDAAVGGPALEKAHGRLERLGLLADVVACKEPGFSGGHVGPAVGAVVQDAARRHDEGGGLIPGSHGGRAHLVDVEVAVPWGHDRLGLDQIDVGAGAVGAQPAGRGVGAVDVQVVAGDADPPDPAVHGGCEGDAVSQDVRVRFVPRIQDGLLSPQVHITARGEDPLHVHVAFRLPEGNGPCGRGREGARGDHIQIQGVGRRSDAAARGREHHDAALDVLEVVVRAVQNRAGQGRQVDAARSGVHGPHTQVSGNLNDPHVPVRPGREVGPGV